MGQDHKPVGIVFDPEISGRLLDSPLEKVYTMTVFERTLRSLQAAEIEQVQIVKGSHIDTFAQIIEEKGPWDISIRFIEENEISEINDSADLLLLSEPLLVTPRYLKEIITAGSEEQVLATDPNAYVAFIGQELVKKVDTRISDNINELKKELKAKGVGSVEASSIGRYVCEPVPDKKSKRQATKRLIRSLRQPSDEFISRTFNRPISLAITSVIGYTPITANQYTIFTGIMGLITAFILSMGGDKSFLIGGIMFHFLAVLDAGDGEIARLKFLASERGQWIDTIVDNITYVATLLGLIIGVFRSDPNHFVIYASYAGVGFLILALLSLYVYLLRHNKGGSLVNIDYSFKDDEGFYGKAMNIIQELGRRPFFSVVFMFLGIFGIMEYSLVYVSIMTFFVFAFSLQAHFQASQKTK